LRLKTAIIIWAALALLWTAPALAGPSAVLEAKWWPSANAFARGQTYPMALRLVIGPGMHINSNQPDDPDVIPTKIKFTAPAGLSLAPAGYPKAKKVKLGFSEKPLEVFDGAVLVRTTLKVAKDAPLGVHPVSAQISFQGCDHNMCLMPETREVRLQVKVVPAGQKVLRLNRDLFGR
jgi:hypothetical protein